MKNYKITVQYDGTKYKGWQVQKSTDMTIQGKIQSVLKQLVGEDVEVIGSGRTDAGVHAHGQVANFHIKEGFTTQELLEYLNHYLPMDIAVISLEEVEERFHSRYNAVEKTYVYRIHNSNISNVFERKYVYDYPQELDIERMKEASQYLVGTHDFTSFCGNKKMKKSMVRTIFSIKIEKIGNEIRLTFTGDGFLQNMIRIITGTLIEVGSKQKEPIEVQQILEKRNRAFAGYTAPPQGLALERVNYATVVIDK